MDLKALKGKSASEKLSLLAALVSLVTLVAFCIYGGVYDYFDVTVFVCFLLSAVCAGLYGVKPGKATELLNLVSVFCVSFGLGLFFLNSYPVWADRLNNISMYGSRGTLTPVVFIMLLCIATAILGMASCFTRRERSET